MIHRAISSPPAAILLLLAACGGDGGSPTPPGGPPPIPGDAVRVTLDPSTTYQTISGWEATAQAGQDEVSTFAAYDERLFDAVVDDLGITRLRLEVRSNSENPADLWAQGRRSGCDRYEAVNDNADPRSINSAGFHFSELDHTVRTVVLPIKQRVEARGDPFHLNVNYVAFIGGCAGRAYAHRDAEEYAEFVVATYRHLRDTFGLVPDTWEVILEPDNSSGVWSGTYVGRAIAAAGARLQAAGFTPRFVAPSTTNMATALSYLDAVLAVPGARQHLAEISYHRYSGVSEGTLRSIGQRAAQLGVGAAMLEHIGSGYEDLHADLTLGRNAAWQQFTLAFTGGDDGTKYYVVEGSDVRISDDARHLRQYFRYVRPGAVRIGASADDGAVNPVAFRNAGGGHAVVLKASRGLTFAVLGLPAGTYGVSYATAGASAELDPVTISQGGAVVGTIPGRGVATVWRR